MDFEIKNVKVEIDENTFQPMMNIDVRLSCGVEPVMDGEALGHTQVFDEDFEKRFGESVSEYMRKHGTGLNKCE